MYSSFKSRPNGSKRKVPYTQIEHTGTKLMQVLASKHTVMNLAAGGHYIPPGLQLPSQQQGITALTPVPNYTALWQMSTGVNNFHNCLTAQQWLAGSHTHGHDRKSQLRWSTYSTTMPPTPVGSKYKKCSWKMSLVNAFFKDWRSKFGDFTNTFRTSPAFKYLCRPCIIIIINKFHSKTSLKRNFRAAELILNSRLFKDFLPPPYEPWACPHRHICTIFWLTVSHISLCGDGLYCWQYYQTELFASFNSSFNIHNTYIVPAERRLMQ